MTTTEHDAFTTAARKRAEQFVPLDGGEPNLIFRDRRQLVEMAEWARDHLAAEIRKAQADAWQAGVNFALPSTETTHIARHNPHRTQEDA